MKCPHCDTTMTVAGCCIHTGYPVRWCPRCGTIRTCEGECATPADAYKDRQPAKAWQDAVDFTADATDFVEGRA